MGAMEGVLCSTAFPDRTKMPIKLKLQSVERLENDVLWIKYEVK